ncbi:MAG: 5-(carboxyamino)imidazole ribonucleotide mutase [Myxococcota bacterium]
MSDEPRPQSPTARVLLLGGSPSDLDLMLDAQETLDELGLGSRLRIVSAHRTPEEAAATAANAEKDGFGVLIAFAGLAAHLAGVTAAHTRLPVIAVPRAVGPLHGIEAALASLQMPPGTPVATVAIDGARNAALLAARILGVDRPDLRDRLSELAKRDRERYAEDRIKDLIRERIRARRSQKRE